MQRAFTLLASGAYETRSPGAPSGGAASLLDSWAWRIGSLAGVYVRCNCTRHLLLLEAAARSAAARIWLGPPE